MKTKITKAPARKRKPVPTAPPARVPGREVKETPDRPPTAAMLMRRVACAAPSELGESAVALVTIGAWATRGKTECIVQLNSAEKTGNITIDTLRQYGFTCRYGDYDEDDIGKGERCLEVEW